MECASYGEYGKECASYGEYGNGVCELQRI